MATIPNPVKAISLASVFYIAISNPLIAQANIAVPASISTWSDQITRLLSEFETNRSPEVLKTALDKLNRPEIGIERRQQMIAWCDMLAVLDKNVDPGFSETNGNVDISLIPPPDHGVRYPSGVDPQIIKDQQAHSQYEAALKSNKEKAEKYNFQLSLHRISGRAMFDLRRFVKSNYTSSESDQKELVGIIDRSMLSDSRKHEIYSAFAPPPPTGH